MSTQANANDAELVLKLYDLRREPEMRKARNWWATQFWPDNADDAFKVGMAMGTPENAWLRQVTGYWEMAASLVLHGAINEQLFMEPSVSGEMFFVFAKVHPFLAELREKFQSPTMMANIEKLINKTPAGREQLKKFEERIVMFRQRIKEDKARKGTAA
jgi:hypothetical protein